MELHVSTPIAGCPALDPACLAAAWVCEASNLDIKIMSSGNHHLSPTKTLPVLLSADGEPISGFTEIASHVLGSELTPIEVALLAYVQRLAVITQWVLFMVPENYEGLTRPEISATVPFPMQYNAALSLQRNAQSCQPLRPSKKPSRPPTGPMNKLHEDMLKQNEIRWKAKDTPQQTMSRMSQFDEIVRTVRPLLRDVPEDSPVRLLLAANFVLMSMNRLPVKPFATLIDTHEDLKQIRNAGLARNYQLSKLTETSGERAYTLFNTIKAYIY